MRLLACDDPRNTIEERDRADVRSVVREQRHAGVETNVRRMRDERVIADARIGHGIRCDDEIARIRDAKCERRMQWQLANVPSDGGFHPFAITVDKSNERDRHSGCASDLINDRVEFRLTLIRRDSIQHRSHHSVVLQGPSGRKGI